MTIRAGFIGLGSQGAPMALRIIEAGIPTVLWARRPGTLEPFDDTAATIAQSPAELGAAVDVLGVCVVDDAAVDDVLRGPDGALAAMAPGSVVLIHSTVHPRTCTRLQDDHPHLHVLDAPVSGGGHAAAAGQLVVMVGGLADVLERSRPVLATYGDPILHLGALGAGQEAKVLNNSLFAAQLALAKEIFDLAAERGLDQRAIAAVLERSSARSYAAEVVAGGGFSLDLVATVASGLLAKDVGILADQADLTETALLVAADRALMMMGVARPS